MRRRRRWFPTFYRINRWLDRRYTVGGRVLVYSIPLLSIGLIYPETPLIGLMASVLAVLMVATAATIALRPRFAATLASHASATVGQPCELTVTIQNLSPRRIVDAQVTLQTTARGAFELIEPHEVSIGDLGAHDRGHVSLRLRPLRRGRHRLPSVRVTSGYPFYLCKTVQVQRSDKELLVLPQFPRMQQLLRVSRDLGELFEAFEQESANQLGEFIGSREYQPGVSVRRWDFRSWARTSRPHVREHHEQHDHGFGLIVSRGLPNPSEDLLARFESMIQLGCSIVDWIERHGWYLSQFSLGDAERSASNACEGRLALQRLATAVPTPESAPVIQRGRHDERGCFILMPCWDAAQEQLLDQLKSRNPHSLGIVICEREAEIAELPSHVRGVLREHLCGSALEKL